MLTRKSPGASSPTSKICSSTIFREFLYGKSNPRVGENVHSDDFSMQTRDQEYTSSIVQTQESQSRSLRIREGLEAWRKLRVKEAANVEPQATDIKDHTEIQCDKSSDVKGLCKQNPRTLSQPTIQDFTTEGKQGQLGCPFSSKVVLGKRQKSTQMLQASMYQLPDALPTPPDISEEPANDPVAVEFHSKDMTSPPMSVAGSTFKCPIRFLDQRSPEEIAKYFENHKHEIPRSHEICVKRYQSNAESIRQLDAKYGDLVNMIQGLGMKHQPMLPTKEEIEEGAWLDRQSAKKVENWAASFTDNPGEVDAKTSDGVSENRVSQFDRSLKEIRVGESPSRPWGISVPQALDSTSKLSVQDEIPEAQPRSVGSKHTYDPTPNLESARGKWESPCKHSPLDSGPPDAKRSHREEAKLSSVPVHASEKLRSKSPKNLSSDRRQMLFTGPVFIGYPAEQAKELLHDYFQNMRPTPS